MTYLHWLFMLFYISELRAVPILMSWTSSLKLLDSDNPTNITTATDTTHLAIAVDFHYKRGEIYFSDGRGMIHRTWLRGQSKGRDPIVIVEVVHVDGLAVDWQNDNLYWTDVKKKTVEMATIDGLDRRVLFNEEDGVEKPRAVVVDPSEGLLFWCDWGDNANVMSSGLDGAAKRIVSSNFGWPNGLTLDLNSKTLYILDGLKSTVSSCNYDGTNFRTLLSSPLVDMAFGLSYYANTLYWTSWQETALISMDVQSEVAAIHYKRNDWRRSIERLMGLKVIHASLQPEASKTSPCERKRCSHGCLQGREGTASCVCPYGFKLNHDKLTCDEQGYLLVSWSKTIRRYNLEGGEEQAMIDTVKAAISMDYHIKKGLIFWSDIEEHRIYRAPLDQLNNKTLVVTVETCDGLAVDWVHDVLYWTNEVHNTLEAASLDGSNHTVLVSEDLEYPRDVALDPLHGFLFWTDWGTEPKIERADLDGSNRQTIMGSDLAWPNGLTIDFEEKKIYWVDGKLKMVASCLYDGSERSQILGPQIISLQPFGISKLNNYIYWTDWGLHALLKTSTDSVLGHTSVLKNSSSTFLRPNGVTVVHSSLQREQPNPCDSLKCKSLCVGSSSDNRKARCMGEEADSESDIDIRMIPTLACEGKTLKIDCKDGEVIRLIRANYGRFSSTICNDGGNTNWNTNCMSTNAMRVLHNKCSNQQNCSVEASNSLFTDPCPGTLKYLEAYYECVQVTLPRTASTVSTRPALEGPSTDHRNLEASPTVSTSPEPLLTTGQQRGDMAYACEGRTLKIDCKDGELIHLIRANYGRLSSTICNDSGNTNWNTNCMSTNAMRVLHNKCSNQQHCSVEASNSLFTDPCYGTLKYLEAYYECVPEPPIESNELDSMTSTVGNDSFQLSVPGVKINTLYVVTIKCIKREGCSEDERCSEYSDKTQVFNGTEAPFTMIGLLPATRYNVRFLSPVGSQQFHITTKNNDPPQLPRIKSVNTGRTHVTVQWDPVDTCVPNFQSYNYRVFKAAELGKIVLEGSTNLTEVTVQNLQPGINYTLHLYTYRPSHFTPVIFSTETGECEKEELMCNGQSDCKDGKDEDINICAGIDKITVYKKTKSKAFFRCDVTNRTAKNLLKFTGNYSIAGSEVEEPFEVPAEPCVVWPSSYCFNISALSGSKTYSLKISAVLQRGTVGKPVSASVFTKEGVPGPPEDLRVVSYSPTSLEIQWRYPNQSNGIIRNFITNIQEMESFEEGNCCLSYPMTETPVEDEQPVYSAKLRVFSPASTYAISITSKTLYMGGSKEIDAYTPPPPMDILKTPELSMATLTPITWQPQGTKPIGQPQYHTLIKYYLLILMAQKADKQSPPQGSELNIGPVKALLEKLVGTGFSILWSKRADDTAAFKEPINVPGLTPRRQYQLAWVQVSQYKDVYGIDYIVSDPFIAM